MADTIDSSFHLKSLVVRSSCFGSKKPVLIVGRCSNEVTLHPTVIGAGLYFEVVPLRAESKVHVSEKVAVSSRLARRCFVSYNTVDKLRVTIQYGG